MTVDVVLNSRTNLIMKFIVKHFINENTAISSELLMQKNNWDCSSATVRNEMMILEEAGLIKKPHHAGGRIPTTKGYHYYINNLLDLSIGKEWEEKINKIFEDRSKDFEKVLNETCRLISDLTSSTIVSTDSKHINSKLKVAEIYKLTAEKSMMVFITQSGEVINQIISIDSDALMKEMKICLSFINKKLINTKLRDIPTRLKELKGSITVKGEDIDKLLKIFVKFVSEKLQENRNVYGVENALSNPDFNDSEVLKNLLNVLENQTIWDLIAQKHSKSDKNIDVWIDKENPAGLEKISLITSNYKAQQDSRGRLAIIGPKNMNYEDAIIMLNWVTKKIEEFFN